MNKSDIESPRTSVRSRLHICGLFRFAQLIPGPLLCLITLDVVQLRKNKNYDVGRS